MYKAPKGIINNPAVKECDYGLDGGAEKRHDVLLGDGWWFTWGQSYDVGVDTSATIREYNGDFTKTGFFNTVKEFNDAVPVKFREK